MSKGDVLLASVLLLLVVILFIKVVPIVRRGRVVILNHPRACSRAEAQHALDRLVAAGIDAEIVEHEDHGINMWANTPVGGEVAPRERYVIQVSRKQAAAARQV
jgi:predicted ATPase